MSKLIKKARKSGRYSIRKEWIDWIDGGASIRIGEKYVARNLSLTDARTLAGRLRREYIARVPDSHLTNSKRSVFYKIIAPSPRLPKGVKYENE